MLMFHILSNKRLGAYENYCKLLSVINIYNQFSRDCSTRWCFKPFKDLGKSCHESRVFCWLLTSHKNLALMGRPELSLCRLIVRAAIIMRWLFYWSGSKAGSSCMLTLNCSKQIYCKVNFFLNYVLINRISKIEEGVDMVDKPQVFLSIGIQYNRSAMCAQGEFIC